VLVVLSILLPPYQANGSVRSVHESLILNGILQVDVSACKTGARTWVTCETVTLYGVT